MKGILAEIASMVKDFGSAPTFAEMPRKTLADKGIAGPTAAHTIEEVHTPLNLAILLLLQVHLLFKILSALLLLNCLHA